MKSNRALGWINNLKLSMKVYFVIILVCLILFVGNYLALQSVCQAYDEQMYLKTAQICSSYVTCIETSIENLNTVTLSMIGDNGVQNKLQLLREEKKGNSVWLGARNELVQQINSYLYNIDEFYDFGICVSEDVVIGNITGLTAEERAELAGIAAESKGSSKIVLYNEKMYFVRQIREIRNFSFADLGTMIGRIDLQKIMEKCSNDYTSTGLDLSLSVYMDDICVYPKTGNAEMLGEDGWRIVQEQFIVQKTSKNGWKFLVHTPYEEIFSSTRAARTRNVTLTIGLVVTALLFSYFLLKRITRQLEELIFKFDAYGKGILPTPTEMAIYADRQDEIGVLNRHFDRMAYEHKKMDEENYNRMLLQKEAQYRQLQQQIQPHFIFNTLSLITWLAYEHKDNEIAELTNAFSRLVRESMTFVNDTITMKKEMAFVSDYMFIQQARFGKRLQFEVELPKEMDEVKVPQMTIQPLVENAVKYALEEMLEPCLIKVWGEIHEKEALIVVEDNGPGIDIDIMRKLINGEVKASGNGIGLQNIQQRIQIMFSEDYGLEFRREEDRTRICVRIPYSRG